MKKFPVLPKNEWPVVTPKNYFSLEMSQVFMGSTQLKRFDECSAAAMAWLNGKYVYPSSDAFLQGSYVHSWNEGRVEEFKAEHPEMFSSRGSTRGQLLAKFKKCGDAIEAIERQPLMMKSLNGQKEVIFVAELFGVPFKIAIDAYNPEGGYFTDLKYLRDIYGKIWQTSDDGIGHYVSVFEGYGYFEQLAMYAEVERLATGRDKCLQPFLAVVDKSEVPDTIVISFESDVESYEEFIAIQLASVKTKVENAIAIKTGQKPAHACGKCDYCKATKVLGSTTHYSHLDIY